MALETLRKIKLPVADAPDGAAVTVVSYFYDVKLAAPMDTHLHRVSKERRCSCHLGAKCPAVRAVVAYLKTGGERAPDPPPGYYPVAPSLCPVCGAEAVFDLRLSSKQRGAGWRCRKTGSRHYWEVQIGVLQQKLKDNPWLFPPVVIRDGVQLRAYDGILPDDRVLYPGMLREEVITAA